MKIVGLVQARMGSSRLPGKVMLPLAGKPLVGHIIDRLARVPSISDIVLATTVDPRNEPLVSYARSLGVPVVRWPQEDDIIGRLLAAADLTGADAFLKINADCPLADPEVMEDVVAAFLRRGDADFASNKFSGSYPLGYSVEVVATDALRRCDRALSLPEDRELVIKWIMDHPGEFRLEAVSGKTGLEAPLDLTVDTPEDYAAMSRIYEALYRKGECFGIAEVLGFLQHPENLSISTPTL